jgi:uncharacterized protein DUF6293
MILECKGLVNVSVGSKIQAIASMMTCMMSKDIAMIKPYYAVPENYTSSLAEEERQETEGLKDIIPMPEYKIEIPPQKLIKCLNIINQKPVRAWACSFLKALWKPMEARFGPRITLIMIERKEPLFTLTCR